MERRVSMRSPFLSRKKTPLQEQDQGHKAMLRTLKEADSVDPNTRLQFAGSVLVDHVSQILTDRHGVRFEDLLGILGSCGGFSCIVGALHQASSNGQTPQAAGLLAMRGSDGNIYYFGGPSNKFLVEDRLSLLSLALGKSKELGAPVSLEMVEETVIHVVATGSTADFGIPRLTVEHSPTDIPLNYVKYLWPKLQGFLDLYEVPVMQRPTAYGFALQKTLEMGKDNLDPLLAVKIVVECATPMSKICPSRLFGADPEPLNATKFKD